MSSELAGKNQHFRDCFSEEKTIIENKCKGLPEGKREKLAEIEAILDLTLFLEKDTKLLDLVHRRWDLYHNLSSIYHAPWTGFISGLILRGILVVDFPYTMLDLLVLVVFLIITCLMLGLFYKARKEMLRRYYPLHKAIVTRSLLVNEHKLRQAFPNYFKDDPKTAS
jgi:hypothetical protein